MASARTGLVAVLLLTMLVGCGLSVPATAGGSGTTAAPTAAALTENASLPPTEGPPQPNGNGNNQPEKPYVAVPTMAAGGDDQTPDEAPAGVHCLESSNLAPGVKIPPEVTLTIAEIRIIEGGEYFALGGDGCDSPVCTPGFRWIQGRSSTCYVAVTEKGDWSDRKSHKITILLTGRAECASGQRGPCEEYRDKIESRRTKTNVTDTISSSRQLTGSASEAATTSVEAPPTTSDKAAPTTSDEAPQTTMASETN